MFLYPEHPYHGIPSKLKPHFITVAEVRDFIEDPLERQEVDHDPLLRRSRFKVTGVEVHSGALVTVFTDFMQQMHTVPLSLVREQAAIDD